MVAMEVLLDEADRQKHGIPTPLLFDLRMLDDLPFSKSGAWEDELIAATGQGIGELLGGLSRGRAKSKVALVWLALKIAAANPADVDDFAKFDIAWRHVKTRTASKRKSKADDADPPAGGSSEPASE